MSSMCISEGLRSDTVVVAAGPLAGLHSEIRNDLGSYLFDAMEKRAQVVPARWRGGETGTCLRGADQVFEGLSQRRKEVDTMFLHSAHQLLDNMSLSGTGPRSRGLTNDGGCVGDVTTVQAAASPEIHANEEGNSVLDALLSHLQSHINLEDA